MKQEKINISLERTALRCNLKGNISNNAYPKAFGDKTKNNFITIDKEDSVLKIKTPTGCNISEIYNKFEEITNVVYVELYNLKEIIWPFSSFDNAETNAKIQFSFDKEFYDEMKSINPTLPENIELAYKTIKENFSENCFILKNTYGNIKIKTNKDSISLTNIRLNYLTKNGISEEDLQFLIGFVFGCLENIKIESTSNFIKELKRICKLYHLKVIDGINSIGKELSFKTNRLDRENKISFEEKLNIAKKYSEDGYNTRYCLQKNTNIVSESVVLIKDAISQGIDFNVLNEAKSLVELVHNGRKEFVIEGNKTDRDTYIFPIITDDKFTSKQIMAERGLCVPKAILLKKEMDSDEIQTIISPFYNKCLVIKPRNTNYGTGITVFSKKANKKQILSAIEYAFRFDSNVLIEEYVKGMEYRFLVVDGKCLSVAHRRIASVVGNGTSTIRELIDEKNKEPWHFLTSTPVKMDEPVIEYLKLQNLTLDSIIPDGERIFLRTNSNCSTGGESIDMTNIIPKKFKKIAEKAAKAFDAKICGVDIIIDDLEKDDYAIIEINDNPGYSINEWPYEGKGEKIGLSILKLLNLVQA